MIKHSIAKFCTLAASVLVIPTVSWAGTETAGKEAKPIVPICKESCISGDIGVNFVSEYISRGLVLENQGVIAQPFTDLYFKLYSGEGFINKVSLNLGLWSSLHSHFQSNGIAKGGTTSAWYEFDYTVGLAVTFAKNFTLTTSYFEFDSPSDNFNPARSINVNLAYDDTDLLGAFALHPHATVLFEVEGAAGLQSDGIYYEVGIAPGFSPIAGLTITLPVTAGFGDDNFYAGDTFGYIAAGVNISAPLPFVPECFGTWTVNAGYTYTYLASDNLQNIAGSNGDENQHVFQGGIVVAF
jgi:hypothetical protein